MTQDLEMKDRSTPSNSVSPPIPSTLQHLKEIATLIETGESQEDDHEMEVDAATSAIQTPTTKHLLPELEIYCYLLVLLFLIDQKKYNEAKACSSASVAWLKNVNRRTVDVIASNARIQNR
ncbi:hypothetical protein KIW84_023845 [Lathyrus oleraceus]|uniref:26S proteasome non-ATPase regulatory subunit 3 N-terminal TPR repeats domain-containing protein n=1 Tax=Pisum sativum TaxID=3888 RepID=A0A9D4YE18_PEA|nr:hypothetical protein KIW84_023845 [Pisum sativum]